MAIPANSFQYLDQDLDVGIKELTDITTNQILSIRQDVEKTIFDKINGVLGPLSDIVNATIDTVNQIITTSEKIINSISRAISSVVNAMIDSVSDLYSKSILSDLVDMSREGVSEFFQGMASVGSMVMCFNLNILQDLLNGYYVDPNILNGWIYDLCLDWMEKVCKPYSAEQEYNSTYKEILNDEYPWQGVWTDNNNFMSEFEGIMNGYLNFSSPNFSLLQDELIDFKTDSIEEITKFLENKEQKDLTYYKENVEDLYTSGEIDYNRYLRIQELFNEVPRYNRNRVIKTSNLPHAKDALGSFIKNLQKVDFSKIYDSRYNTIQKGILQKLKFLKGFTEYDVDYTSRIHGCGSFDDYNFDQTLSIFTDDEIGYLATGSYLSTQTTRYNNIHPTSELFILDSFYRRKKIIPSEAF